MDFYEILQQITAEKGLSIPEVARLCGLSDGTVRSMVVRKSKYITLEVAFKMANGLGVSLERLNGIPECEEFATTYKEKKPIPMTGDGLNQSDIAVARAYHDAGDGIQSSVRKLLDVELSEDLSELKGVQFAG